MRPLLPLNVGKNEISIIYKLVSRTVTTFIPLSNLQSAAIKGYGLIVRDVLCPFLFIVAEIYGLRHYNSLLLLSKNV